MSALNCDAKDSSRGRKRETIGVNCSAFIHTNNAEEANHLYNVTFTPKVKVREEG